MKRKRKKAIKKTMFIAFVFVGTFVLLSVIRLDDDNKTFFPPHAAVSKQVRDYKPMVETYAAKYDVSEHVDVLLAMMMQESGGRGSDPMQSSESYCGSRGCINDPEMSIKQGVSYFSRTLEAANGDVELAIQSYNFGKGFIDYVAANSGAYSEEAAIAFSQKMYKSAADKSQYSCLREAAKQYNACYGDIHYVRDVLAYRNALAKK
ncbi:lysozyme family protein [Lentibacillus cibarius]|uniref:Lysozyme family protein n=1 Tax=Lentibacillus cibarius TaxID=2583219 RepID=A0A549YG55_9BACI|nr:lysozyme family protein [Lentibacillus cibarius]TMN22089.1 lysozyme family protein [Lentibacillus cibarius]TRM10864.1 lysozyme family protein [Lentibacillus cibarius]